MPGGLITVGVMMMMMVRIRKALLSLQILKIRHLLSLLALKMAWPASSIGG